MTTSPSPTIADNPTAEPAADSEVHVVVIETKFGADVNAYRTREAAERAVYAFVSDWWDTEVNARLGEPVDREAMTPRDAIDMYFETVDGEFYSITSTVASE